MRAPCLLAAVVAAVCLLFHSTAASASDDFQYWSRMTLKLQQNGPWSLAAYGETRLSDDATQAALYQIGPQISYAAHPNFDLGANYTYLETEAAGVTRGTDEFKYHHRAELELRPHWEVGKNLKIKNRNRVEFRWIEDQGSDNTRFRQLWELEAPLQGVAPLLSLYANCEWFYDFKADVLSETRTVPLGVSFRLNDKASLKLFWMIQAKRGSSDWSSNEALGTHLTVSF